MTTTEADSITLTRGAGPLTTVFTTPDFCSSLYWTDTVTPPLSSIVCMPPRFHQLFAYSWGFYSPGICPAGYTEGCSFPRTLASTSLGMVYYGGPVLDGEGVRVCCPTGYTCLTGTTSSYSKCVATADAGDLVFAMQVRWQESDLSVLETNPTVPGSKFSAQSAPETSRPPAAAPTASTVPSGPSSGSIATVAAKETSEASPATSSAVDSPASGGGGLSNGVTIGIAAGAMAAAFFVSALIFFIWRHRKRQREREDEGRAADDNNSSSVSLDRIIPSFSGKPELDSNEIPNSPVPSELQATRDAAEMPVPHFVAELPGSMPAGYQEGYTEKAEQERSAEPKSPEDFRRRSTLKGHSLYRTISSPSTPSAAGGSPWRARPGDVSSVESLESGVLKP